MLVNRYIYDRLFFFIGKVGAITEYAATELIEHSNDQCPDSPVVYSSYQFAHSLDPELPGNINNL